MMETIAGRYESVSLTSHQEREELHSEGYTSLDEMDGLSGKSPTVHPSILPLTSLDSQSTFASHSRPTTLADHTPSNLITVKPNSRSRSFSAESENSVNLPHFAVPTKAIHILGLVPGTLPYAQACLENARDDARRLTDIAPHASNPPGSHFEVNTGQASETKKVGGRMDRARKALSIHMPSTGSIKTMIYNPNAGSVPSVIMALSGEEEEMKRERRRKVADGVLHWQKEVQRLRDIEELNREKESSTVGRKGSKMGRR